MKKYLLAAFIATVIAQSFIPLKMIYDSEMAHRYGTVYKFKTAPVDPSDPFRGKYITLNFDVGSLTSKDSTWANDEKIYVHLKNDNEGFAHAVAVSRKEPVNSTAYFITTVQNYYQYNESLSINVPFNRFYMEEGKALEAETGYIQYTGSANAKPAYALVALRNGNAVITNVIIDGMPIKDYVVKNREMAE